MSNKNVVEYRINNKTYRFEVDSIEEEVFLASCDDKGVEPELIQEHAAYKAGMILKSGDQPGQSGVEFAIFVVLFAALLLGGFGLLLPAAFHWATANAGPLF